MPKGAKKEVEKATKGDLTNWWDEAIAARGETLVRDEPLNVEASNREFHRLVTATRSYVAMYSPPDLEDNAQFLALARLFAHHGVHVPAVLDEDRRRGFFLLEDLGAIHFADVYATRQCDEAIEAAIETLRRVQTISSAQIPPYTLDRFEMELGIFKEWFLENLLGQHSGAEFDKTFRALVDQTQEQPQVCVHRDYHCRNLLYNDGSIGVVDFQDALVGPVMYDLASLLHDCYHVFTEADRTRWLEHFIDKSTLPLPPLPTARRWLDLTALQRQLKAIGIFARLYLRDGKTSHLKYIVPLLPRIQQLAERYPETRSCAALVERLVPAANAAVNVVQT